MPRLSYASSPQSSSISLFHSSVWMTKVLSISDSLMLLPASSVIGLPGFEPGTS